MRGKHEKPAKTSNIVLAVMGVFILAFVVTMIITFWKFGTVPDTLIQYTLGAGGIEAVVLAGIKITKTISGKDKDDENDFEETEQP